MRLLRPIEVRAKQLSWIATEPLVDLFDPDHARKVLIAVGRAHEKFPPAPSDLDESQSRFVDHASGVSARFAIANYRTVVANARRRGIALGESPAVPRVSDLAHLKASAPQPTIGRLVDDAMAADRPVRVARVERAREGAVDGREGEEEDARAGPDVDGLTVQPVPDAET